MKKRSLPIPSKKYLPWYLGLLELLLIAGCITLLMLCMQPNSILQVARSFIKQPLLIVLNVAPVALLILSLSCLIGNVAYASALLNLPLCTLAIANRLKIQLRSEAVYPRDFALLREAAGSLSDYHITCPYRLIALMLGASLLLLLLGCVVKNRRSRQRLSLRRVVIRLLAAAASFGVLVLAIFTLLASEDIYNSFTVSNQHYSPSYFNQLGFPYCFCHQFSSRLIDVPTSYSESEAASWETGATTGLGTDVHVIMVMNEAFSDITDAAIFDYDEEDDPLTNLHALQSSAQAITGHIVIPCFGAGTASTEFDVLTGIQTRSIAEGCWNSFNVVYRNMDSLYRLLNADGYLTSYYHPGYSWYYNRVNVLSWLGAQSTLFIGDMEDVLYKGSSVTDSYVTALIEAAFEDAVTSGEYLFNYTTTIQNHQTYTTSKYGSDSTGETVRLTVDASEDTTTQLSVYVEGLRDADAMLGELVAYFNSTDEPVLLVFFGDHLPSVRSCYEELGLTEYLSDIVGEDPFSAYETPFVIYANDAAVEALDWYNLELDLPENNTISASYLGALVVEIMGKSEESPWYTFLNELRRELPVAQVGTYMLSDGTYTTELSDELASLVDRWRCWSYYRLTAGTDS